MPMNELTPVEDSRTNSLDFEVTQTTNPSTLLSNLLGDTTGLSNFGIRLVGDGRAFGTFKDDPFHLTSGIALSTGKVENLIGENTKDGFLENGEDLSFDFGENGQLGDSISLVIEFDVDDTKDTLYFQYVFGSEEFIEFAGRDFNDNFSLKLNGFNLARLSDGAVVNIDNLAANPLGYHPDYIDNPVGDSADNNLTRLDGFTKPLTFSGPLLKNARNTLTIDIQDARDGIYDSVVLLKGETFGTVEPDPIIILEPEPNPNPNPTPETPTPEPNPAPETPIVPRLEVEPSGLLRLLNIPGQQLQINLERQNAISVNEVIVAATDPNGAINGILPDQPGYEAEFFKQAQVIFSTLTTPKLSQPKSTRTLELTDQQFLQFAVIQDGSLDEVLRGSSANTLFTTASGTQSVDSTVKLNQIDSDSVQMTLQGPNFSTVLNIDVGKIDPPLGIEQQGLDTESELIDFRDQTTPIDATFKVYRNAKYNSTIGLYAIEDEQGSVRDEFGNLLQPGDEGYTQAALRNRVDADMTGQNGQTLTYNTQLTEGNLFSVFIVANGSVEQLLDSEAANDPNIYFNHIGANTDGVDHMRLLGDNTFGFEDLAGGGDRDFNDIIVKAKFSV